MKTATFRAVALAALVSAALGATQAQAQIKLETPSVPRTPDVIFVPTPQPVVDAMLRLASVQPGEMVYDLGCGDGRAVITAARDFQAKGIGVDIDPQRISESRQNAQTAGVTDRVEFKQEDLFQMNFSDADVLFLYLLPTLNVRLRPRILDETKPGTRVVSHAFSMEEWEPDERTTVAGKTVYFWVVPAKVAGEWRVTLPSGEEATLSLTQEFQKVTGSLKTKDRSSPLSDAKLKGSTLTFRFGNGADAGEGELKLDGSQLTGEVKRGGASPERWTARRSG